MEMPFATMKRTQETAHAHKQQGSVTVHVRAGIHFMPEAATFTKVDSAIRANQVIFRDFEREPARIRAGILLDYAWELY